MAPGTELPPEFRLISTSPILFDALRHASLDEGSGFKEAIFAGLRVAAALAFGVVVGHVRHCLEKTEFLVVQDVFPSETAQMADIVLPAASFAEKEGTFTATDRRIQLVRKAIEPLGDSREDWEIICQLAQRMGATGFDFAAPKEVMDELAQLTPIYHGVSYERLEAEAFCTGRLPRRITRVHPICTRVDSPEAWVTSTPLTSKKQWSYLATSIPSC